jgi:hypothetical protein
MPLEVAAIGAAADSKSAAALYQIDVPPMAVQCTVQACHDLLYARAASRCSTRLVLQRCLSM